MLLKEMGKVIGDEPEDTGKDPEFLEETLTYGEGGICLDLNEKSVGKADALKVRFRFASLRWEIETW